jgi:gluconate 2-dehydrogenase gamma chain
MKRRDALRNIALGPLALLAPEKALANTPELGLEEAGPKDPKIPPGRTKEEAVRDAQLKKGTFFTPHELKTVTVLSDIILPADADSGSASQVGVPAFIEFMMKDQPQQQTPMRGGLMWLDNQAKSRFGQKFVLCSRTQQIEIVDDIAYPEKASPAMKPGAAFFNMMRNLVLTGFYTTETGIRDLGYVGNRPNTWPGVPKEVLAQYGFEADE